MSQRLQNKVAVVTGAASGIGEATARLFIAEGAQVLLTDLNLEAGERIAAELGDSAAFMHQDVSDPAAWQALAARVRERYQRLDVLVSIISNEMRGLDIYNLDLSYAPPYSSVNDAVHYIGLKLHALESANGDDA